jgi:hypothetical protein
MFEFENDEDARLDDLDFIEELRAAELGRLWQLRVALSYTGPRWMAIAVQRAIDRALRASSSSAA